MERSFEKQLEKEDRIAEKEPTKLRRREFACEADAREKAEIWLTEDPLRKFEDLSIKLVTKRVYKRILRPKNDEKYI